MFSGKHWRLYWRDPDNSPLSWTIHLFGQVTSVFVLHFCLWILYLAWLSSAPFFKTVFTYWKYSRNILLDSTSSNVILVSIQMIYWIIFLKFQQMRYSNWNLHVIFGKLKCSEPIWLGLFNFVIIKVRTGMFSFIVI